jgi:hypothetical protein
MLKIIINFGVPGSRSMLYSAKRLEQLAYLLFLPLDSETFRLLDEHLFSYFFV